MSIVDRYRDQYEHEKDSNAKMLDMLDSVPEANRGDPRFRQAVTLTGHLAACRENWLDKMASDGENQVLWWDAACDLATLRPRFAKLERDWTDYLAHLDEDGLARDFSFPEPDGNRYTLPLEAQIIQLIGHAAYHRGQIAILVDQLGGETVDTDYIYWKVPESA